jgi:hypothetical protein
LSEDSDKVFTAIYSGGERFHWPAKQIGGPQPYQRLIQEIDRLC